MGLDGDDLGNSGANLHQRICDTVKPVLSEGVHRLLHRAELIGGVFIENRYTFIEIFRAGDEGIDLVETNGGIGVGLLRRLKHELLERARGGRRFKRAEANADDCNALCHGVRTA